MDKLTAIIVEDEEVSRDILRNYLGSYCPDVQLLGEATNIEEGEKLIKLHQPTIVFLDIEMPHTNGFDLLKRFPNPTFGSI